MRKISMNVLFLSLGKYKTIEQPGIYTDLLREIRKRGHKVFVLSSIEARDHEKEELIHEEDCVIARVYTGDIQKTNIIKKGINTLLIQRRYTKVINRYFKGIRFDLVLYPTPPITFVKTVWKIKKRDNARTYLMLKDIFPQNAVDIGLISKTGVKGFLYKHFRKQEKSLYSISDHIGCMSRANVDYIILHNPEVNPNKVEVCPNSIEPIDKSVDEETRKGIRVKYNIPIDKIVYVYGGNLGKPQGISFIINCLRECTDIEDVYFLIVGDGTEYGLLESYIETEKQQNVKLMKRLPKEDYDTMVGACDIGLLFLDHRFTIPNFPSRLLSYMQARIPVLAVTDPNTDIGKVIVDGGFGWWIKSESAEAFKKSVISITDQYHKTGYAHLKANSYEYLVKNYTSSITADIVLKEKMHE